MDKVAILLKRFSDETLKVFLENYSIPYEVEEDAGKADRADDIVTVINEKVDEATKNQIEFDANDIHVLSSKMGSALLKQYADRFAEKIDNKIFDEVNQYDRSFWFFLHKPDVFKESHYWLEAERMSGWKEIYFPVKDQSVVVGKSSMLSARLKLLLRKKEMTGDNCQVDQYEKGGRVYYIAYPDGHAGTRDIYVDGKVGQDSIQKTIEKIYYIYDTNTGALSVKAKYRSAIIEDLQEVFGEAVLGVPFSTAFHRVLNLNAVFDENFEFHSDPEEKLEFSTVKSICLYHNPTGNRITYELADPQKHGIEEILSLIEKKDPLSNHNAHVSYLKIHLRFEKNTFPGKRGRRTIDLRGKNTHNLTDGELDSKVKELLIRWGIYVKNDKAT